MESRITKIQYRKKKLFQRNGSNAFVDFNRFQKPVPFHQANVTYLFCYWKQLKEALNIEEKIPTHSSYHSNACNKTRMVNIHIFVNMVRTSDNLGPVVRKDVQTISIFSTYPRFKLNAFGATGPSHKKITKPSGQDGRRHNMEQQLLHEVAFEYKKQSTVHKPRKTIIFVSVAEGKLIVILYMLSSGVSVFVGGLYVVNQQRRHAQLIEALIDQQVV